MRGGSTGSDIPKAVANIIGLCTTKVQIIKALAMYFAVRIPEFRASDFKVLCGYYSTRYSNKRKRERVHNGRR